MLACKTYLNPIHHLSSWHGGVNKKRHMQLHLSGPTNALAKPTAMCHVEHTNTHACLHVCRPSWQLLYSITSPGV